MEKNRKRAIRRHHYDCLKKSRSHYWGRYTNSSYCAPQLNEGQLGVIANTPCTCSCWMCGNPRRLHKERTYQEILSEISFIEQCEEEERYVRYAHHFSQKKYRNYF